MFLFFQYGDRLYTSESDVYERQILTSKVDPRTVGVNVLIASIAVFGISFGHPPPPPQKKCISGMNNKFERLGYILIPSVQIYVIFTHFIHLKLRDCKL